MSGPSTGSGHTSTSSGRKSISPGHAVVIGASFAGLLAAAGAAKAGYQVTVLERDALPADAEPRPGVPQSEQAHILLHRGLVAIESLLPGLEQELIDHGGKPFNTSMIPWLGEWGWMPLSDWSYNIVSISRPMLEQITRQRIRQLPEVVIKDQSKITGLRRLDHRWAVLDHDQVLATADVVIDASGRSSRLPHWLADLGIAVEEPVVIDSRLGYATRRYRGELPLRTGVVVTATPETLTGALLLPIEGDDWLVCAAGYGDRRPERDPAEFDRFLADLRDPALADAARALVPVGDIAIHRQTANRRYAYGTGPDWPAGLFVVGDALCAFNPVYGQGITVAATQAALLPTTLAAYDGSTSSTRRLQRRLAAQSDLPWSVATSEDLRMPTSEGCRNLSQRLMSLWTTRMIRLAVSGDEACTRAFSRVYHLMGSPLVLFRPAVTRAILWSLIRGVPSGGGRPPILATPYSQDPHRLDQPAASQSRPPAQGPAGP
jgi:2-polyprenyl-6-methoxyphenol hydroxylase-like FAD-dependent oxidoreductase